MPVADRLAAKSDEIASALDAGDVCTAAVRADELQDETLQAINSGQVPPEFQEDLTARVNELVNSVNCPPPPEEEKEDEEEDEDKDKKKDKDKKDEEELVPTEPIPIPTETGE